jgi:hypothetical protein
MTEEELAQQLKQYTELKKENKDIDVAALALAALKSHEANLLTAKEKRIAYLVSLGLPPFGLLYGLKFWVSGKDDGKQAAYMCAALTIGSIVAGLVLMNLMLSSSGLSVDQIKQAPAQYQQLLQ